MHLLLLIIICIALAGCSSSPTPPRPVQLRPDVLYYPDTDAGRNMARDVVENFGGKQEVAIVDFVLPSMTPAVPGMRTLPAYPPELRSARVDGEVIVEFIIDERGTVLHAIVVKTSNVGFNSAALAAIRSWTFSPAKRSGMNVRSRMQVPVSFKLVEQN